MVKNWWNNKGFFCLWYFFFYYYCFFFLCGGDVGGVWCFLWDGEEGGLCERGNGIINGFFVVFF